ncbi:MAG: 30S ribosomal protein S17 [Elusimicrobiaceae bacterium]|nr:30S ribosomal protein S17 [Elusimicrobiaceae bacterium]MBT6715431.1 30S ribosomal protein S17 [Elusimicrobiaceae bacterium]MBT7283068.1 30S ribosomal protein S17 [Elusimicrobiaceae bacterium]
MEKEQDKRGSRKALVGIVVSDKQSTTRVIKVERLMRHAFYGKIVKRAKKYHAHDKDNASKMGDKVEIMSVKPISKLKKWLVTKVIEKAQG